MAISKIILNGEVQMDVTSDTVTDGSMLSGITATKNDGTKATGTIASNDSSDLTVSGATVTAPAGYYASNASKSVTTMTLPTSTSSSATSGYSSKATLDRSTSDRYINIPLGYNSSGGYYKINKVANGTAGTPTATKGTVSNHSVSVTPSVTNTTGYITGGTKTGTAVTVSASELVSGDLAITQNGNNINCVNYSTVSVNVPSPIPIFTVDFTASPVTATCNKSYNECVDFYNTDHTSGAVADVTIPSGSLQMGVSTVAYELNAYILYTVYTMTGVPAFDLRYYPNGTIAVINPSMLIVDAGTPTATKGTVSNHSVSVTPSVTNTSGYITGSTKTGTAVTVTASELVSGTKSITENGTGVDVTNYASVDVAVESAASSYTYIGSTTYTVSTTSTTSISVGTFATGDTSIWTYDKMVYVKIRDVAGPRVGYYYGCDAFFYNAPPPAGSSFTTTGAMCGNMYTVPASNGRIVSMIATLRSDSTASTTGYGIYPTWLHSNGEIDIKARYSSTSTGRTYTIDGTYSVEVYLLDWPGGIAPYQE